MSNKFRFLFLFLLIFPVSLVFVEEIDLGVVEVVGTVDNQHEKNDMPERFTTIIEIDKNNEMKSMAEVLSTKSEIFVKDTGSESGVSTVSIRGSSSKNVLILLDGVAINTAGNSSVDISMIPLSIVDRIEIIKGGDAALSGSGAMGGVINIVTRESDINFKRFMFSSILSRSMHQSVSASIGDNIQRLFVSYSYKYDKGNFLYYDDNGTEFDTDDDYFARRKNNSLNRYSYFIKYVLNLPYGMSFTVNTGFNRKNNGVAGPLTFQNHFEKSFLSNAIFDTHAEFSIGNISQYFTFDSSIDYKADSYIYTNPSETETSKISKSSDYLKKRLRVQIFAVPYNLIQVINDFSYESMELIEPRFEYSFIIRDEIFLLNEKVGIVPVLRLQFNSDLADPIRFLWSLGTFFSPFEGFKIKINGFSAFRNPDFNELYYNFGQYRGNDKLKAETSYGGDFGIHYMHKYFFIESIFFCNYYMDLIEYILSYGFVYTPINIGEVLSFGAEFRADIKFVDFFKINLSYNFNYVLDVDDLQNEILAQLPNHPFQTFISEINFNFDYYHFGVLFKFEDKILIVRNGSKLIPEKFILDAYLRMELDIGLIDIKTIFFVNGYNLLNFYTRDIRNYPLEGIRFDVGIIIEF